jgi:AbrB family looped-hinge helix DNA binding protein
MASISITKMSSKGQVVIPQDMRGDIEEGETLVVIKNDKQIILEKMENFDKNLEEDLEFAKRTEMAWKQVDEGKFTSYTQEEFLKELENDSR